MWFSKRFVSLCPSLTDFLPKNKSIQRWFKGVSSGVDFINKFPKTVPTHQDFNMKRGFIYGSLKNDMKLMNCPTIMTWISRVRIPDNVCGTLSRETHRLGSPSWAPQTATRWQSLIGDTLVPNFGQLSLVKNYSANWIRWDSVNWLWSTRLCWLMSSWKN